MTDQLLDCLGLKCPLPVMKARKRLRQMSEGATLTVLADDPLAPLDLENMAREDGHVLLELVRLSVGAQIKLVKGGA